MSSINRRLPGVGSPARLRGMSKPNDDTLIALPFGALHKWHGDMREAFAHVDAPDALHYLASAFGHLVSIESVMISLEHKDRAPQLLYQRGIPEQYRDSIIDRYFSGGYLLDPFCLAVEQGLAEGFYHLEEIAPDNFFDSEYYKTYYLKTGCSEDSFYLIDTGHDSQVSVSLFQGFGGESLRAEQLNLLRAVEPLVREFVSEFGRRGLVQSAVTESDDLKQRVQSAFENFGCDVLTEREREVAHMVLRGHSVKSTASQMSISPETVRMHRKNLYLKLEVGSQSELFALFIEWLRQH
ncbi:MULTISPECIES: helix-turn-helix transcriptional regulator [Pseudomonas]|jgi:DNA-binding CsgD family transcriptional regulator|uniref:helix-turn-helix transcriptional regulator n=1 Tax=Pseudomonas TaxID=286 RepID=UPI000482510D|nr:MULTISPECIES: helix-turn-helix transcriptional regulator [Pseudomonas]MBF6043213.1 helix-turn-helix transcriptional regulator [Pseudomonas mucoides]CRL51490.1 Transcriptional regulatory protein UhpA [Pseudomonas sp. URMO17WK12:I11]